MPNKWLDSIIDTQNKLLSKTPDKVEMVKNLIANAETKNEKNPYTAKNKDTTASGKYQIITKFNPDYNIEKAKDPQYQESYMDNKVKGYLDTANKLQDLAPNMPIEQIAGLIHFKGASGTKKLLSNTDNMSKSTKINPSANGYLQRMYGNYDLKNPIFVPSKYDVVGTDALNYEDGGEIKPNWLDNIK